MGGVEGPFRAAPPPPPPAPAPAPAAVGGVPRRPSEILFHLSLSCWWPAFFSPPFLSFSSVHSLSFCEISKQELVACRASGMFCTRRGGPGRRSGRPEKNKGGTFVAALDLSQHNAPTQHDMAATADIGLVGLAVMGENLVLNMLNHGFTVAVYNRTTSKALPPPAPHVSPQVLLSFFLFHQNPLFADEGWCIHFIIIILISATQRIIRSGAWLGSAGDQWESTG